MGTFRKAIASVLRSFGQHHGGSPINRALHFWRLFTLSHGPCNTDPIYTIIYIYIVCFDLILAVMRCLKRPVARHSSHKQRCGARDALSIPEMDHLPLKFCRIDVAPSSGFQILIYIYIYTLYRYLFSKSLSFETEGPIPTRRQRHLQSLFSNLSLDVTVLPYPPETSCLRTRSCWSRR